MELNYELAQTHYLIQRWLELAPGSQAYAAVANALSHLPPAALIELFLADPEVYRELIPLSLMAARFQAGHPESYPLPLQQALEQLFVDFSQTLIQEQEHLLKEQKLARYPFARHLLLDEILFHRHWNKGSGRLDRDRFRLCLATYAPLLQQMGNPYLLQVWQETGWLQRWQIAQSSGRPLPTQSSLKNSLSKFKLSENSKRYYKELEQNIPDPHSFFEQLANSLQMTFADNPLQLNDSFEPLVREWVQLTFRHVMKKSFRVSQASQCLLQSIYLATQPLTAHQSGFVLYTLTQELLLGTQNLNYRLNDVIQGLAQGLAELNHAHPWKHSNLDWVLQAILDLMMEIYESFSLCENSFKSFMNQYHLAEQLQQHQHYEKLAEQLQPILSS